MCPINDSLASPSNDSDLFGAGPPLGSSFTVTSFRANDFVDYFLPIQSMKNYPPCDFSLMARFDTEAGWLRVDLNWRKILKILINKRGPAVMQTRKSKTQINANILANRMWESEWASPRARQCGSWSLPKRRIVRFTYASICKISFHQEQINYTRLCLEMCLKCPFMSLAKLCDRSTDRYFSRTWFYW